MKPKRSLYQCFKAKIHGDDIVCAGGHTLPNQVCLRALERGKPLEPVICQKCRDFEKMGPSVPTSERGWL